MEININQNDNILDDSLYSELLLMENIVVPPEKFNSNLNSFLEDSLKNKNEEKCISEGYIKKDSINIFKKSLGTLKGSQFNGYINYVLMYKALVCNPKSNSIVKCKIKLINNKLGLLGHNGPLTIIVGKQLHNNPSLLDEYNVDDIIEVKIIESKFSLNDKEIRILAKLKVDSDNVSKNNIDVDDLNEIDAEDIDDNTMNTEKDEINNIELDSLDGLDSEIDEEEDLDDDLDQLDDIDDIEENEDDMEENEVDMDDNDELGEENDEMEEENDDDEDNDNYS